MLFVELSFILLSKRDLCRGMKMNLYTVRFFAKAIRYGSKYVYQTVPRLLTIWLDLGEDSNQSVTDIFKKLNELVAKAIKDIPAYKVSFLTIALVTPDRLCLVVHRFPPNCVACGPSQSRCCQTFVQIDRNGHTRISKASPLAFYIRYKVHETHSGAAWQANPGSTSCSYFPSFPFCHPIYSRSRYCQNPSNARTEVPMLIAQCISMTNELLALCDYHITDDSTKTLTMSRHFPRLAALGRSQLIIPLQESLTASLPPTSSSESIHQPFPPSAPTFEGQV